MNNSENELETNYAYNINNTQSQNIREPTPSKEDLKTNLNIDKTNKSENKCLLILNLQRPFVNSALEVLLGKYGKIEKFWLDFIKTHSYVQYSTIDEAREARHQLNGIKWPQDGKKLIVDYVNQTELDETIEKNKSPFDKEKKEDKITSPGKEEIANVKNNDNFNNTAEEPIKTLDSLFKKTTTKPHIYYLPLSEEEVEEKRKRLKKRE